MNGPLDNLSFYITNREQKKPDGQLKCKKRMDVLFAGVRTKYSSLFKAVEEIELNRAVLGYVVGQLQGYSLLESPVDVKGVAYEEIVGSNPRGDRGEFFTPRNACKMAVALLSPLPGARIIDPACGTGGFLVTAMNHVLARFERAARKKWRQPDEPTRGELEELYRGRQELIASTVVGLDINPNLVRASKMNMVMNNDGSGGLTQADSLRQPITWTEEARNKAALGTFDYVFTNPPFGAGIRIDNTEVLEQYELAALWDWSEEDEFWKKRIGPDLKPVLQSAQPPEILFIERSLQLLKPGKGKMAIVIPNGILNNPPLGYVRQWILKNAQVLAIIDMQRDLFQPRNDTQTSMVFLRRKSAEEKSAQKDYPIFMAVTSKIGHDKRGRAIYKKGPDGNDILETRRTRAKVVEEGKIVEKVIEEKGPVVDDQLPEIPTLYAEWAREHGL
jgi:type I restriction enzyme M protein